MTFHVLLGDVILVQPDAYSQISVPRINRKNSEGRFFS